MVAVVGYAGPRWISARPSRPTRRLAFGPAGNGIIAFEKDGDILAVDRPDGDPRPLVAGPELDSGPMFSPDGTRLAFRRVTDAAKTL